MQTTMQCVIHLMHVLLEKLAYIHKSISLIIRGHVSELVTTFSSSFKTFLERNPSLFPTHQNIF